MMKARQTAAQAAANQKAPQNKPTGGTAAQSEPRANEKKETQIEVDPIAKKITDIIYSEDNSATGESRNHKLLFKNFFQSLVFRAALLTTLITAGLILYCRRP